MKTFLVLGLGCAFFLAVRSFAGQSSAEQVDSYVQSEIQKQRIPGLALAYIAKERS